MWLVVLMWSMRFPSELQARRLCSCQGGKEVTCDCSTGSRAAAPRLRVESKGWVWDSAPNSSHACSGSNFQHTTIATASEADVAREGAPDLTYTDVRLRSKGNPGLHW